MSTDRPVNGAIANESLKKLLRDTIFIQRTKFLWKSVCHERISVKNYGSFRQRLRLDILFDADFQDLFQVRGTRRLRSGKRSTRLLAPNKVAFYYLGLDGVERKSVFELNPAPVLIDPHRMTVELDLGA